MGTWYRFQCPSCRYAVEVSGKDDTGMGCALTTIVCEDCGILADVVTSEEPWLAALPDWTPSPPQCEMSPQHTVRKWTHPGPCPKCGEVMERGKGLAIWE
jgi:hypothetical protein